MTQKTSVITNFIVKNAPHFPCVFICLSCVNLNVKGGKFFFLEHVREQKRGTLVGVLQTFLKWPWWCFFHCRVANDTGGNIRAAGFSDVEMEMFDAVELTNPPSLISALYLPTRSHVSGVATK